MTVVRKAHMSRSTRNYARVMSILLIASTAFADPPKTCPAGDGCNTCTGSTCTLMACGDPGITLTPWHGPPSRLRIVAGDPAPAAMPAPAASADAPVRDFDAPGRSLLLEQGEIAPFGGVLLDQQEDVRRERARVRAETTVTAAQEGVLLPRPAFIAIVLGCAAASAAIAAGVTAWALKK